MKQITIYLIILFTSGLLTAQSTLEKRLDSLLQGYVTQGRLHGCMAYVYVNGEVIINKPYGYMDVTEKTPMQTDAIFRLASMTKVLTAAAALRLYENGEFLLDDPVKKYIPEFGNLRVLSPDCKSIDSVITVPLERDVTVRDLFRHTAGFTYGGNDIIGKLYIKNNIGNTQNMTLKEFVQAITNVPLKFQPGSKWEYSYANDVLGYLVEVISGKPLDEYMQEAVFKPLHMDNTGFQVPIENLKKLCNFYEYSDNKLVQLEWALSSSLRERPKFFSGGGGGVSTMEDYAKFCQMLLNFGEYRGKRIFRRETIELLISNQIGEIKDRSFDPDGFGFGIGVNPKKYCGGTARCYWAGSPYNNTYSIDFEKQAIAILLTQNAPWGHLGLMDKFQKIVAEEIK